MIERKIICEYSGLPSLESYMEVAETKQLPTEEIAFNDSDHDRIIQMAWEDRTPFEAIEFQFGLKEKHVMEFMRKNSVPSSFVCGEKE